MPKSARVTDSIIGSCGCDHGSWSGVWVNASPDVDDNSLKQVRAGDMGVISCPCGVCYAVGSSPDVDSNGILEHRLGDNVICACGSGTTVSASPDTDSNG
jgi:hypothetical protein